MSRRSDGARDVADALALAPILSSDQVIDGRYRIERMLGQGGMGVVYAAVHQHTARAVALKLVHCTWSDQRQELYQRFLGEARTASLICHPNVVDVLDMGFVAGAPYLVMERLSGESLDETMTRLELLPLASTIGWLLPVMGALAALHEKGVVHRDVKPSNIFLSRDAGGRIVPKLLDFGLARVTRDAPITESGVLLGTPEYMAPERARGQEVGPLADVWAMGVVVFECMCGRLPFTATSVHGIAAQIIAGEVQRARDANPSLPLALAAVIDRALMPTPEERHESMAQFAYALGAAALSAGLELPPEPDPIGLPNFSRLLLQNDPWFSGPLAKASLLAARDGAAARASDTSRAARARGSLRARGLPVLLVVLLLAGLCIALQRGRNVPTSRAAAGHVAPPSRSLEQSPEPQHEVRASDANDQRTPVVNELSAPSVPRDDAQPTIKKSQRSSRRLVTDSADPAQPRGGEFEKEWY